MVAAVVPSITAILANVAVRSASFNRRWHLFPNATEPDAKKLRERIRLDLDEIRNLRNRLAHHEPVISRNLASDLARMLELVELRSTETSAWLASLEEASTGLGASP